VTGYPIVLDVSARLVVIVGGGSVSLRKARGLVESGASRVRVVAPSIDPAMPAAVERIVEEYQPKHLHGASLVFAATDSPTVNESVVRDAREMGALTCRADVDEDNAGDFATPAMLRKEPLLVTVSSGGSPALSAMIRDRIAQLLDPRWIELASAMRTLRPSIRLSLPPARRREVFRQLCSDAAMDELASAGIDGLKRWLKTQFTELDWS
jgi:siroheme synthase-like protein